MNEDEQFNEEELGEDDLLFVDSPKTKEDPKTQETHETDLPEKFQGKSVEDVVKSYQNLEKELSRKNNEVGELRNLTDEFLKLELNKKTSTESSNKLEDEISDEDLFNNPEKVVNDLVSNNPAIKKITEQLTVNERKVGMDQFESVHPDWQDVVTSTEFNQWVSESNSRLDLFKKADTEYNYELGSELLTLYKQINPQGTAENTTQRNKALRSAAVETKSTGVQKAKVYSRAAIMNMRLNDPKRYEAMQDVIEQAYIEGRVR